MRSIYLENDGLGLAQLMARGDAHPSEVLDAAIELCEELDPELNAVVITDFERAREHAASSSDRPCGTFGGVPFLLKDLYAGMAGLRLTNGSRLYQDNIPDHDTYLVERYKEAGLAIFGRSASPEFGLTTTTESVLHGKTHNPWHPERTAGGSSGGAASAVAAGIVPAAHASDGGGSIRIPASCCGLFGLKPTRARVTAGPDKGEGWAGFSTNHVVSRTVRDSAALLDATCAPAAGDPYWAPQPGHPYLDDVKRPGKRLRIAICTDAFNGAPTSPECRDAALAAGRLCEQLGHRVEEAKPRIDPDVLGRNARVVVAANIWLTIRQRSAELGDAPREDLVEPLTWATARLATDTNASDYAEAIVNIHAIGREVGRFFENFDVLLSPTMATAPPQLGAVALTQPDNELYLSTLQQMIGYTQLMNVAGNPAMSVPLAWSDEGLPLGVQFAAAFGDEHTLLSLAAELESAQPWTSRRPPIWGGARA